VTVNPLVAARVDQPKSAWAGVWIAEDIELIAQGVENRSWVDGTLGVVGAGLDGLALVSDPVGALLQYGISWLIEHVRPLSEALDWLAGDPGAIAGHAQTWRNVASSLRAEADELARSVRFDLAEWSGAASDAYRRWASQRDQSLQALARASDTMALITEGAGILIGTVRMMVRDAVATVVSRLIVYAGELVGSLVIGDAAGGGAGGDAVRLVGGEDRPVAAEADLQHPEPAARERTPRRIDRSHREMAQRRWIVAERSRAEPLRDAGQTSEGPEARGAASSRSRYGPGDKEV
jgi:uncharacterized protein YukE